MTLQEAVKNRHTVRKYADRKIPKEAAAQLRARINENNQKYNLEMKLVLDHAEALGIIAGLTMAKGVRNYIVLAGKHGTDTDEKLGYCGANIMLCAQMLGLNTWWVGSTFSAKGVKKNCGGADDCHIIGIIAIGYGAAQGVPHKSKTPEDISSYSGSVPAWFSAGVEAVLFAPTARNKQAFAIQGMGNKVSMTCHNGTFSAVDLGIGKYHFEVGAGKENFEWA